MRSIGLLVGVLTLACAIETSHSHSIDYDAWEFDAPFPEVVKAQQSILYPLIPTIGHGRKESLGLAHSGELYFSAGKDSTSLPSGTAARLKLEFVVPTLILDHALESYESVKCDGGSMSMTFHSQEYFEFVKEEWSQHHEMVVITSDTGCASYSDGSHHTYFKASGLVFQDSNLGLALKGNHMELEDIMDDALLEFGHVDHLPLEHRDTLKHRDVLKQRDVLRQRDLEARRTFLSLKTSTTKSTKSMTTTSTTSTTSTTTSTTSTTTSTTTSSSATQCGTLTTSSISGMPAATCGPDFDQVLDSALGYYSFDADHFIDTWAAIAPGASVDPFYNPADLTSPPLNQRGIKFTGHFTLGAALKSLAKAVVNKVQDSVKAAGKALAALPGKIASAAKGFVKFVVALIEGHPSVSLSIPMSWHWGGSQSSPWGFAKLIHVWKGKTKVEESKKPVNLLPSDLEDISHIAIYCVKCGFNGTFKTTGSIGFNRHGIYSATLDQVGDLDLGIGIGVDALAVKSIELVKKTLYTVPLPGLGIPKIIALGPILVVQAGMSFETKAMGQVLFQGNFSFKNAQTHTDYLDRSKSFSKNWKPTVGGGIDVHGAVSAGVVFELPVAVAVGLDVLNGKFSKKALSIVDTTSLEIEAKLELAASASGTANSGTGGTSGNTGGSVNDGNCFGVAWNASLKNKLSIDIIEAKNSIKLFEVGLPIAGGCVSINRQTPTGPSNPAQSSHGPSPDSCESPSGNMFQNGDFSSGTLAPWYNTQLDPGSSFSTSTNALVSNHVDRGDNPYSAVSFRQAGFALCPGQTYTFSFDYQYDIRQGDVYIYVGMQYADGTPGTGIFGARDLDNPNIGHFGHYSGTFVAASSNGIFEIAGLTCNYEHDTLRYDNFVITANGPTFKRSIEARQDSENVELDQTVGGVSEDDANTPDPDNVDLYNPDGSVRAPPDDSDLDGLVEQFADNMAARDDAEDHGAFLLDLITQFPPASTLGDGSNTSPLLPDADGNIFSTLPLSDGSGQLSAGDDGNLYFEPIDLSSPSGQWEGNSGVFGGDFNGRFLHVYSSELSNLQASRIRLSDETAFPQTGLVVGLVGIKIGSTNNLVAMDTSGNIYYLVACNFAQQRQQSTAPSSKLFVVSDQVVGLQNLNTALASWTVTGGVVTSCAFIGINPPSIIADAGPIRQ